MQLGLSIGVGTKEWTAWLLCGEGGGEKEKERMSGRNYIKVGGCN